ncbi:hypothetical protein BJ165DRAFT_1533275 [Panaeolus papilionaceus]|nr:hypothetical protein BJ165DRAFT_1533275 [Panaeolus papilionaceus]
MQLTELTPTSPSNFYPGRGEVQDEIKTVESCCVVGLANGMARKERASIWVGVHGSCNDGMDSGEGDWEEGTMLSWEEAILASGDQDDSSLDYQLGFWAFLSLTPPSIVLGSIAAFAVPSPAVPAIPALVAAVVLPPVTAVATLPPVTAVAVPVPVAAAAVPASVTATVPLPVATSSAFTNPPAVGFMIGAELASQYTPEEIQAMLLCIERQEEELSCLCALEDSQDSIMPNYDNIPDGSIPKPCSLARSNLQAVMGLQDDKDLYNEVRDVVHGCVAHLKDQFLIEWCHQDPRFVQTIINVANLHCPYLKQFRHGWATHEILKTTNKNKCWHKKVIQRDPMSSIRKVKAQARKMKLAQWVLEREAEEAAMEQEQDNGGGKFLFHSGMQVEEEASGKVEEDIGGNGGKVEVEAGGEVEVEGMVWVEEGAEGFVETAGAVADAGQADGVAIGSPGLDISPFDDKELSQGDDNEAIGMPDKVTACSKHNLTAQHHFTPFDTTPDLKAPAITTQNT